MTHMYSYRSHMYSYVVLIWPYHHPSSYPSHSRHCQGGLCPWALPASRILPALFPETRWPERELPVPWLPWLPWLEMLRLACWFLMVLVDVVGGEGQQFGDASYVRCAFRWFSMHVLSPNELHSFRCAFESFPRLCRQEVTGLIQTFVSWSPRLVGRVGHCTVVVHLKEMNLMSHDLWVIERRKGNWRSWYVYISIFVDMLSIYNMFEHI